VPVREEHPLARRHGATCRGRLRRQLRAVVAESRKPKVTAQPTCGRPRLRRRSPRTGGRISVRDQQSEYFLDAPRSALSKPDTTGRFASSPSMRSATSSRRSVWTWPRSPPTSPRRRPHEVIAASHKEFDRFEAFGVPTFRGERRRDVCSLHERTERRTAESVELITSLLTMMTSRADLNEFKHTQLPR